MKNNSDIKAAGIYAKALYETAQSVGSQSDVLRDAEALKDSEICSLKEAECFVNPVIDFSVKSEIVEAVAKKLKLCPQTLNMLKILIKNKQFKILELVLNAYTDLYNRQHNITEVVVETVKELSKKQDEMLNEKLSELFNCKIKIKYLIEPKILGGLIIRNGTKLIDLSLENQLKKIGQLMKGTD
jgi:F-type H+-transporting ATPase subunit delta